MKIALFALVLISFALASCADAPSSAGPVAPSPGGSRLAINDDLQCRVLADVANQLGSDSFVPYLKSGDDSQRNAIDCTAAFKAAGVPVVPYGNPNDPRVNNTAVDHAWQFSAPEFSDDDAATVKVDYICRRLCGHGEKLTLSRQGSYWKITQRETTWVS